MIRYVIAILLAVALLGLSTVAIDHVSHNNSQQQMENNVESIESAAESLVTNEEVPPPGQHGAQRVITVELPEDSLTSDPVTHFEIRPADGNTTTIEYRIDGGATVQRTIGVPIVYEPRGSLELGSPSGTTYELTLVLTADENGDPVVTIWEDDAAVDHPR